MKTSLQEKIRHIQSGSPIEGKLLSIFGKDQYLTICDIGACEGLESILYKRIWPNATIYSIEAREDNYLKLRETIDQFGFEDSIIPLKYTLSDKVEEVAFYSSYGESGNKSSDWETGNKSSSLLKPTGHIDEHPWCQFKEERCLTIRFDSLPLSLSPDFLHMDVQGAEIKVMMGMGDTIDKVQAIFLEVASVELYEGQPLKHDIFSFMTSRSFKCSYDSCQGKFSSGDQLWIR